MLGCGGCVWIARADCSASGLRMRPQSRDTASIGGRRVWNARVPLFFCGKIQHSPVWTNFLGYALPASMR